MLSFQTALLAALAGQLLVFMKDPSNFKKDTNPNALNFLLVLSYSSVVLNASATITSLILTDKLGELPFRASQDPNLPTSGKTPLSSGALLKLFRVGESFNWAMWHCEFQRKARIPMAVFNNWVLKTFVLDS